MRLPIVDMHLHHGGSKKHEPKRVIVHAMGEFIEQGEQDVTAVQLLDRLRLSAHALVTPSGVVIRCRDDEQLAWHARDHNTGSLGVEFLVPGVHTYATFVRALKGRYLTTPQYSAGVALVAGWCKAYGIDRGMLLRHSDVDPGRKLDPGDGFPWQQFVQDVVEGAKP